MQDTEVITFSDCTEMIDHIADVYQNAKLNKQEREVAKLILCENLTQEEADSLEIELIERYKATDRNSGYNHHYGGQIHDVCSVEDLLKEDCLPYEIIEESELLTKVFDNLIDLALGIEWTETIERKYYENNQLQKVEKEVIKRKNKPSYFAIRTLLDNYSDCEKVKPLKDKLEKMRDEIEESF